MSKEKLSVLMSCVRVVVALLFTFVVIYLWANTGIFLLAEHLLLVGAGVIVIATVTQWMDYKICPEADTPQKFLHGMTLRMFRALCDLVPLWVMGMYVFLTMLLHNAHPVNYWLYGIVFVAGALSQVVFDLPNRDPYASMVLGKMLPIFTLYTLKEIVATLHNDAQPEIIVSVVTLVTLFFVILTMETGKKKTTK